ncbi:MAG: GIY-YIG nuclease family protein [Candidatus Poseidoniaceae archaeon]
MVDERSDIKFPMWRKKVDGSLFEHSMTAIPKWVERSWKIPETFEGVSSKKDERSKIDIQIKHNGKNLIYTGWVTISSSQYKGRPKISSRLEFEKNLTLLLQEIFVMSHMRELERRMRSDCKPKQIEEDIPFYEFLDIEWNEQKRLFILKAHYKQKPIFPELFKHLRSKHILNRIEDEINDGLSKRISKGDWKEKSEIKKELSTENVIYTLIDRNNAELYVGEAENLAKRFKQVRNEIPGWTHYRVDQLPEDFDKKTRVHLERMMIRFLAALINNDAGIESMKISEFILTNKRIDR